MSILYNLWLFYAIGYVFAYSTQVWANKKRGEPFDDPEFLFSDKKIVVIAMIWLFGGLIISIFVPVNFGFLFYIGLTLYILVLFKKSGLCGMDNLLFGANFDGLV